VLIADDWGLVGATAIILFGLSSRDSEATIEADMANVQGLLAPASFGSDCDSGGLEFFGDGLWVDVVVDAEFGEGFACSVAV
jgi:hypothetical protein